jgi:HJR/Mrr/RecB family endonuclease
MQTRGSGFIMGKACDPGWPPQLQSDELRQRLKTAEQNLRGRRRQASRDEAEARRRHRRLHAAIHDRTVWIPWLVGGSILATLAGILLPMLMGTHALGIFISITISYALAFPIAYSERGDTDGETDATRVQIRGAKFRAAEAKAKKTTSEIDRFTREVETQRKALAAVVAIEQSGAFRKQKEAEAEALRKRKEIDSLLEIDLNLLEPDEFERYVARVFTFLGFATTLTGKTGDQGVDVIAERPGMKIAIQAKRYAGSVGNAAVMQVCGGMKHYGCRRCCVVTSAACYTSKAIELAQSNACVLICRDDIPKLIRGELGTLF